MEVNCTDPFPSVKIPCSYLSLEKCSAPLHETWCQCCETFYSVPMTKRPNTPDEPFQPSLLFSGKARSQPKSGGANVFRDWLVPRLGLLFGRKHT
jgi:hypothetical protein